MGKSTGNLYIWWKPSLSSYGDLYIWCKPSLSSYWDLYIWCKPSLSSYGDLYICQKQWVVTLSLAEAMGRSIGDFIFV